jgi:hypothetical protein
MRQYNIHREPKIRVIRSDPAVLCPARTDIRIWAAAGPYPPTGSPGCVQCFLGGTTVRARLEPGGAKPACSWNHGASTIKVLACTTCASLPETIELTWHAFDHGAYVAVMPPFFSKMSRRGCTLSTGSFDQAVPANGRCSYHIPQVWPISFADRQAAGGGDNRVVGIKDSAGDLEHCRDCAAVFPISTYLPAMTSLS